MPKGFASRAQMGWLFKNKPGVYKRKLVAQTGDSISTMPYHAPKTRARQQSKRK